MKLAFVINDIATEQDNYSTIRLTRRCVEMGIDVSLVSQSELSYMPGGALCAPASRPSTTGYADDTEILADLQEPENRRHVVTLNEVDVLMLRADPAKEIVERPWAHPSGLLFAQLIADSGVIVVNDPRRLTDASNKTYFQQYPEAIRPRTCITRDAQTIRAFIEDQDGRAVIKPLQGSGGEGVFVITDGGRSNLNQMIEATVRFGYAIVQEYLPAAADGDLRLITLNGRPLQVDGTYACFRRYNETEDARSNITAGGAIEMAEPDEDAINVAEIASPKLVRDGMYLAGLDIVGATMMEINVDTPGGIGQAEDLTGIDFSGAVLRDLRHKVRLQELYGGRFANREIAMM
ncbi:glutathione synthase [Euzebya tangerina]|uniref:glutathione synthase n=1 Tax=Euzebya tangerina TaxID=591198 RepID=UPI000E31456C|nr:glutathione synthase [Euzebya tangerina]